jgi:hypothetical protein
METVDILQNRQSGHHENIDSVRESRPNFSDILAEPLPEPHPSAWVSRALVKRVIELTADSTAQVLFPACQSVSCEDYSDISRWHQLQWLINGSIRLKQIVLDIRKI